MKYRTADLEGEWLNQAVANADAENYSGVVTYAPYSTNWEYGGLIIERERIYVCFEPWLSNRDHWEAGFDFAGDESGGYTANHIAHGPTPLIAAMRAYVASKLGEEVELDDSGVM